MTSSKDIEQQLDRVNAAAWKPEPGDKLVGEVVELGERDGGYGTYPIVVIEPEGGEPSAVHAFHDVLRNELARVAPRIGDVMAIRYDGKQAGERGYHRYKVVSGRASAFNWDKFGDVSHPEPDVAIEPAGTSPSIANQAAERFGDDVPWE